MINSPHPDKENIEKCTHKLTLSKEEGDIYFNTCDEVGSEKGLIHFLDINPHLNSGELFKVVKSTFMFDATQFPNLKKDIRRLSIDRIIKNP